MEAIDLILPAHNEANTIGHTLVEFHQVVTERDGIPIRFVVGEDGSTDGTVEIVQDLAQRLPIRLISEPVRKGYSKAVIDGFRASTSSIVGFIDSDGQCDPADFQRVLAALRESDCDLVVGYRNPRRDHWIRLLMSGLFKIAYGFYFQTGLRDPSCPYLMMKRPALLKILEGNVGILKQGFWWEFTARARALGLRIQQIPVAHRLRKSGTTQVYRPTKVPRIAFEHLRGLSQLRRELRRVKAGSRGTETIRPSS